MRRLGIIFLFFWCTSVPLVGCFGRDPNGPVSVRVEDGGQSSPTSNAPPIQRLTRVEFAKLQHATEPPKGPQRTTIRNVTMESLDRSLYEWDLDVPPRAVFDAYGGISAETDVVPTDAKAKFILTVATPDTTAIELIEAEIEARDNRWSNLRADLGAFAGKRVRLVLSTEVTVPANGVRAVWGNPVVMSQASRDSVPVIIVSCDTTRADHLGCYGYARDTSPNIDAFAREAVLFEDAVTPETWTLTAHISMLTGLYPLNHRVSAESNLAEEIVTLPQALTNAGYAAAGFTGYGIWMHPTRGFAHGFDLYSTPPITRDIFRTMNFVFPWLDAHASVPFFLFFHNYDHHSKYKESDCAGCDLPYYPPRPEFLTFSKQFEEPAGLRAPGRRQSTDLLFDVLKGKDRLSPKEIEYMVALYDDSIRGVDAGIGEFFDKLKSLGLYDKSLIIITSDHGELFGEHGQFLHEHVYEGAARVPLLIRFPKGEHAGRRVRDMVSLIDLAPTVLDVTGVRGPAMDGQSLLPVIRGEAKSAPLVFIRRVQYAAARSKSWKLVRNLDTTAEELYKIEDDPAETRDLISATPLELGPLRTALDGFIGQTPRTPVGDAAPKLTDEDIEALRAQGYAGEIK